MGKAYSEEQKKLVKALLESGKDEESIEKDTGVSDRTIRRWKLDLQRTGRIGKPPESRTGRHRVLSPELEAALIEHANANPRMSVDDLLWWLHKTHGIVVGTRTVRRVFERKGDGSRMPKNKSNRTSVAGTTQNEDDGEDENDEPMSAGSQHRNSQSHIDNYQAPFAPMIQPAEQNMASSSSQHVHHHHSFSTTMEDDLPDDEETIQLQLEQIALQKREVELKLKMLRIQQAKSRGSISSATHRTSSTSQSAPSKLYNPAAAANSPAPPKRDSRSKKKIEESKKRTAERQERMLKDLERRSRRRDHLTAEWVQSKDIWPLRAQAHLADLMHRYMCYAPSPNNVDTIEAMYRDLYQLVDHSKNDWDPAIHDDMLRERMKRKMGQLRTKMQKTGEIIGRGDSYGAWQKADDFTGEQAGNAIGDESELPDAMQAQGGASSMQETQQMSYDMPDHQAMQHGGMAYPPVHYQAQAQYGMLPQQHHHNMLYGQMDGQQGMHQESMVI